MKLRSALLLAVAAVSCGAAVFLWATLGDPLRSVRYSFALDDVPALAEVDSAVTFGLIADVHLRGTPRSEIPGAAETERILDNFLRSMDQEVKPDFIVQLGDFVDGWTDTCQPFRYDHGCRPASNEVVLPRLRRLHQVTKDQTSIPWFDVMGNHEYVGARPDEVPERLGAIRQEWTTVDDTWYYRDVKGFRLIFLNTAHPPPEVQRGGSHVIPERQIAWLNQVLADTDMPIFAFMHVPLSEGDGTQYDLALNQESLARVLSSNEHFVAGFFGHSHHSDAWDGLRTQQDAEGNTYFHVPAPHEWMGDTSQNPWVVASFSPEDRTLRVEVGSGVVRSSFRQFRYLTREAIANRMTGLRLRLWASE